MQRYIEKKWYYSFSITTEPILTTIGTSCKEFPDPLKEVSRPSSKEDIIIIGKPYCRNLKIYFLQIHWPEKIGAKLCTSIIWSRIYDTLKIGSNIFKRQKFRENTLMILKEKPCLSRTIKPIQAKKLVKVSLRTGNSFFLWEKEQ